ncbi:hypothetical protein Y1Q_0024546 [Alligator mississippiensis]|uniref:Uncharacterized protein n=1 Tax=Alligator mississippiensis TaxID=8496 RepID=A0A151NB01_ALLMI|nr:hypothetical protein Y1Q_0024546 [Alligator mississippiensis]
MGLGEQVEDEGLLQSPATQRGAVGGSGDHPSTWQELDSPCLTPQGAGPRLCAGDIKKKLTRYALNQLDSPLTITKIGLKSIMRKS